MFSYCENNPVNYYDPNGKDPLSATAWVSSMWGLMVADGLAPIGDIIFVAGFLILSLDFISWSPQNKYADSNNAEVYSSSQGNGNSSGTIETKSVSTPAAPPPPGNNKNNRNNYHTEYKGGTTYNQNGVRIDYEYYGKRNGNVHIHLKGEKYTLYIRNSNGSVWANQQLPAAVHKAMTSSIRSGVHTAISIINTLGGYI